MAQKTVKRTRTAAKPKGRKAKAKKVSNVRFVCRDCSAGGKGGFFTAPGEKGTKCPYCSSANVKILG